MNPLLAVLLASSAVSSPAVTRDTASRLTSVCGRTPAVRLAIESSASKPCGEISADDLAEIGELDVVGHADLATLAADDLQGLTSLWILRLTDNGIETLPEGLFAGLKSLGGLYLDRNPLTALPSDLCSDLSALELLSIEDAALTEPSAKSFRGCDDLGELHLNGNNINKVDVDLFQPLARLSMVDLSYNPFLTIDPNVFAPAVFPATTDVFMSGHHLTAAGLEALRIYLFGRLYI